MKSLYVVSLFAATLVMLSVATGQQSKTAGQRDQPVSVTTPADISDRALGVHNRNNIGMSFENRGRLYPRRSSPATPCGEWPIKSGMEYIFRMNPFVGIPGNVIQCRWVKNEEWEAAAGYHNRDSAKIAFSDKPNSWPATGWPVRDAVGNPVFVSDQDSYCVYNDSNNTKGILNIQINQTGYAYSAALYENMVCFTYQVVNKSTLTYDSLYFGLYCDIDVGDVAGVGTPEYADDLVGFNKQLQLLYFYDDGYTADWPGNRTGYFGVTMLKTPPVKGAEPGITDFHYNVFEDDADIDTLQYGILSSAPSLYASPDGSKYFHLGANAPDLHFDDPATIPATGLDVLANLGSGPYTMKPGDTLTFATAIVAGLTLQELLDQASAARGLTDVLVEHRGVAGGFSLGQNYPNPFNPTTVISYQLPAASDVRLVVYDVLGREVAVLVNERKTPGSYEVKFDGSGLTSGVYLYRLTAGSFVQTRKLLLLR